LRLAAAAARGRDCRRHDPLARYGILLALVFALTGCGSVQLEEMPGDPAYAPLSPVTPVPDFRGQGAIQYAGFGTSLFSDRRAAQVGDIITVRLSESTQASKDADTAITKDQDIQFNQGTVLGEQMPIGDVDLSTNATGNREFDSTAESSQSNSLTGAIAVSVTEVLPNGLLRVRGEKWLQLNRGQEYIRLTGLLRQQDLAPDNSISSTKLADVRIGYSGTGELAQANNMGWLGKFFNHGWFPL
jgi:flagellar L-ring protein precursor FlgH